MKTDELHDLELKNCNFVKTIMMLLVVLYHSMIFWTGAWEFEVPQISSISLALIAKWLNSFHIYTFTFVSGYIFAYKVYEEQSYTSITKFVVGKVKRLLIPAIMISLLWVVPISQYFYHYEIKELIKRYVLCIAPNQLWFLWMLFWVFLLSWLLKTFFKNYCDVSFLLVLGLYCVGIIGSMILPNVYQIWTALQFVLFFFLGIRCREYRGKISRKIPIFIWFVLNVLIFFIIHTVKGEGIASRVLILSLTLFCNIAGTYMAFYSLQYAATMVNWEKIKAYTLFQKESMGIFLIHQQIIYISLKLFNGSMRPFIHAGVNFIIASTVSIALVFILQRHRGLHWIIGE